jgi:hypothetical protein
VIDDYDAKMPFKFTGKLEKVDINFPLPCGHVTGAAARCGCRTPGGRRRRCIDGFGKATGEIFVRYG